MSIFDFLLHFDLHSRDVLRFYEYTWDNKDVHEYRSLDEIPDFLMDCTSFRFRIISPDDYPYTGLDILVNIG